MVHRTATVLAALLLCSLAASGQVVDRVLAVVGSRVITLSDARAAVAFGFVRAAPGADALAEALTYLVNRQLILIEVDRYAAPPPDAAILGRRLDEVRGSFAGPTELQAALDATAMTEARLRDLVSDTIRIETYLDQRFNAQAQPTGDEVERYYRDHAAEFTREGRLLAFDDVRPQVQARLVSERRSALIADWLDRLRRRVPITTR